jgi:hypothetical protein
MVRPRVAARWGGRAAVAVLVVSLAGWGCGYGVPGAHGHDHTNGSGPRRGRFVTLLDNLGDADSRSRIAEEGRDGYSVAFDQSVGLLFHVTRPTVVTEVGGFVQSRASFTPGPADVIVEIHPTLPDGRPDRDSVLAAAPVSPQEDPLFITFQRARFRTFLRPGDYYALFALAVQTPPATEDAVAVGAGEREVAPGEFVPWSVPSVTGGVTHPPNYDPSVQMVRAPFQIAQRVRGVLVPRSHDDCREGKWWDLTDEDGSWLRGERECDRAAGRAWARSGGR